MNRYFIKRCYYSFIPALTKQFVPDSHIFDRPDEYDPQPKTGFERVRAIFQPTKDGMMSKEYYSVVQLSMGSFLFGLLVGAPRGAVTAHENFLIEHRTSKFITAYEARRKLFDHTMFGAIKDGYKWGTKAAIFTFLYTGTIVVIAAYRGYDGFLEYLVGGAFAGAFVRAYLGYKAAFTGALLGATLSTFIGVSWYILMKFDTTPSDARQMFYDFMLWRREKINEARKRDTQNYYGDVTKLKDIGLKSRDEDGHSPDDEDNVFVMMKEPLEEKPKGIDAVPNLPNEKLS